MMRSMRFTETFCHYHRRQGTSQSRLYIAKTSFLSKYGIISLQAASSNATHTSKNMEEDLRTQVKYMVLDDYLGPLKILKIYINAQTAINL